MRKAAFCIYTKKTWISCIPLLLHSIMILLPKSEASSHLLWFNNPVCVRPGRNRENRFSHDAAHYEDKEYLNKDLIQYKFSNLYFFLNLKTEIAV